jgi:hypothetical protein
MTVCGRTLWEKKGSRASTNEAFDMGVMVLSEMGIITHYTGVDRSKDFRVTVDHVYLFASYIDQAL